LEEAWTAKQPYDFLRVLLVDLHIPINAGLIVLQRVRSGVLATDESKISEELKRCRLAGHQKVNADDGGVKLDV
jgi:hypothetical protein